LLHNLDNLGALYRNCPVCRLGCLDHRGAYSATTGLSATSAFCRTSTMEVWVSHRIGLVALERSALRSCAVALLIGAVPAVAAAATTPVTPASLTDCGGHITGDPGAKAAREPNLLDYRFSCDGNISAYTIIVDQQGDHGGSIDDYNPAPSVFEADGSTPSPSESITCEGTTPSDAINCNLGAGGALTAGYFAAGSVDPLAAYCKHLPTTATGKTAKPGTAAVPQALVQLVVTDATGAEDGPFTLGPARACPHVPNVVPQPKPKSKSKSKSKTTSKGKRRTAAARR
jgi:hypothetical protein